jgi:hypothetical protein
MLQIFEDHVANIMHARGLSRSEAEHFAYEAVLIDWLNATHPDTLSDRCAHCGKRERPDAILLPIGVGIRHTIRGFISGTATGGPRLAGRRQSLRSWGCRDDAGPPSPTPEGLSAPPGAAHHGVSV